MTQHRFHDAPPSRVLLRGVKNGVQLVPKVSICRHVASVLCCSSTCRIPECVFAAGGWGGVSRPHSAVFRMPLRAQSPSTSFPSSVTVKSARSGVRSPAPLPTCVAHGQKVERRALEACSTGKRQRQQPQIWALQHSVHSSRAPAQRFLIIGPTDRQTHNRHNSYTRAQWRLASAAIWDNIHPVSASGCSSLFFFSRVCSATFRDTQCWFNTGGCFATAAGTPGFWFHFMSIHLSVLDFTHYSGASINSPVHSY